MGQQAKDQQEMGQQAKDQQEMDQQAKGQGWVSRSALVLLQGQGLVLVKRVWFLEGRARHVTPN